MMEGGPCQVEETARARAYRQEKTRVERVGTGWPRAWRRGPSGVESTGTGSGSRALGPRPPSGCGALCAVPSVLGCLVRRRGPDQGLPPGFVARMKRVNALEHCDTVPGARQSPSAVSAGAAVTGAKTHRPGGERTGRDETPKGEGHPERLRTEVTWESPKDFQPGPGHWILL